MLEFYHVILVYDNNITYPIEYDDDNNNNNIIKPLVKHRRV